MSPSTPKLTCELIAMVAQHLIADNAFSTCAALNVTSKKVREATLEVLWTNMYWTAYNDPARHDKKEVAAKWKVFKKSRGAKYIKFMIEPCLFKSQTGYDEDPQISKSLSKTIKASVTLVTCAGQQNLQVHLFGKFGYTEADKDSVTNVLNIARSFPAFQSVSEIYVCVHAKVPAPTGSVPINTVSGTNALVHTTTNNDAAVIRRHSAADTVSHFQTVNLQVDKSVKIKDLDDAAYDTITDYALSFVRPYAGERMEAADASEPAQFIMVGLKIAVMVGFGSAWMRLWEKDPFYTTFDISLFLEYDEETGKPFPTSKQPTDLHVIIGDALKHIKVASQTVPLRLLGGFHTSNHRETVYAEVSIDAQNKVARSNSAIGFDQDDWEEEPLHDVEAAAE